MGFQDFTTLDVWLSARQLANSVYIITREFPSSEQFGLTSQMGRCVVSIPSNIAEGVGRNTAKGTLVFLYISRGSLFELETQFYLALDQQFINKDIFNRISDEIQTSKKLLNGFINYFKKVENGK
ncbi:four helix bundle protein [Chryseobacterium oryctis]|uniref:Four helix bundle protein n=1 Tax=Chryseobacterium oryctis TaxID=2952618 RepID=A0ABT3HQU4_9FLAO|nr:four helix bundle protein [Chryseobacterium oryctis]MCW3162013.1 four helix bundle protein [Chryseobacterium oryctis]